MSDMAGGTTIHQGTAKIAVSRWAATKDVIGTAWHCSPRAVLASLAEPLGAMAGGLSPLAVTLLVSAVIAHSWTGMWIAALALALLAGMDTWTSVCGASACVVLLRLVGHEYDRRLVRDVNEIRVLDDVESAEFQANAKLLSERSMLLGSTVSGWLRALQVIVQLAAITVSGALISPWLLVIPFASIPAILMQRRLDSIDEDAENASAGADSGKDALLDCMIEPRAFGEMRLWHAGAMLRGRMGRLLEDWRKPFDASARKTALLNLAPALFSQAASAAVLVLLTVQARNGTAAVASVVGACLIVTQLQQVAWSVPTMMGTLLHSTRAARRALWIHHYVEKHCVLQSVPAQKRDDEDPHAAVLQTTTRSVHLRFADVAYRYPGATDDALTGISVDIAPGTTVALVGENGSGKTTFLDCALGLRRPASGTVSWTDARGDATTPRVSAVVQDYMKYEASLGDNIGFGGMYGQASPKESPINESAARASLSRVGLPLGDAGIFPWGLRTLLGARWGGLCGLSGGQWQRVAIARCIYPSLAGEPIDMRVLDEASSALDAHAEEQLRGILLGAALPETGITFYVTHRFPTIKAADLILVFEHGRLVEQGTHTALIERNGAYTRLFNAQTSGYQS